ncbi:type I polyketide synthase [Micromonospora eburnea]|uniref:Acyl transferase domain-containing protein n=1 Tax=Micromonospora eburnea TaxID=227316 RepID=A0A1C6V1Z0_9ACTN|nr:type I polyketide synthase [Micromonospora eburnea]SCL60154.1 Acyl transferase domain-containing protein [Micromonospora eburnea]
MDTNIDSVAIIGLAARVPGAADAEQFWQNLNEGRNCVRIVDEAELVAAGVPRETLADPRYVRAVAQAPDIDLFDAEFFGMTPREAQVCDPQIRLFLEAAHAAVEDAGYRPSQLSDVGVFGAAGSNRYLDLYLRPDARSHRSLTGISLGTWNNADSLATLVSYKLNFRGPSMTVQTACSSSLTAVHQAVNSIRMGECDMALAGGAEVELPLSQGYWWTPDGPLSRDGLCRPFAAAATGTVFGSGVGVVFLKRLSQALADGDQIRAIIRGTAVNNDGAGKMSFTAPGVDGQSDVVVEALTVAGVEPRDLSLVEAHGTGTALGDPIEVSALKQAFARLGAARSDAPWCRLGSVKANIGHLGHAAGVASLIKTVLCLEHERVPGLINVDRPNPELGLEGSPLLIDQNPAEWPRTMGRPRLAGVSSLGVGGTNVHVLVEEGQVPQPPRIDGDPKIIVWSARSAEAADAYRGRLAEFFARPGEPDLAATASTLQHGRTAYPYRSAVVASSSAEAAACLTAVDASAVRRAADRSADVAFLLPGQGAQHSGMAADLYPHEPAFATALDELFDLFAAEGLPVADAWRSGTDRDLADTLVAQPVLFAVEIALYRMWQSYGVRPAYLLGHSVGELAAAAMAGVFDLPDAVRVVAARAHAMARTPAGAMLAVAAPADEIIPLLPDELTLAVDNGPRQCVVAGKPEHVDAFARHQRALGQRVRPLPGPYAFHTAVMEPAAAEFEKTLRTVTARPPSLPLISARTGRPMTPEEAVDPRFWAAQLVQPVRFGPALAHLLSLSPRVLLEVGPGRTLASLARSRSDGDPDGYLVLGTLPPRRAEPPADRRAVRHAVSALWSEGLDVNWSAVSGAGIRRAAVPGYPYQRVRHWCDAPTAGRDTPKAQSSPVGPGFSAPAVASTSVDGTVSPFTTIEWAREPELPPAPTTGSPGPVDALALLPADDSRARDLVVALNRAGLRVTGVPQGPDDGGFHLTPGRLTDLAEVLRRLAGEDRYPQVIVHGWTLDHDPDDPVAERVESAYHSLAEVVRQGVRSAPSGRPGLLVLTRRSVDVSGSEAIDPATAALHPLLRTVVDEEPGMSVRLVDVGDGTPEDALVAELARWREPGFVALRGHRRWCGFEAPYRPATQDGPALRRGGVYLLTGGTGGLGLAVAKAMAATGQRPYLALLSRSGTAPAAELAAIRALGADVRVHACDVSDRESLRALVDEITEERGPVAGVLHLAGVPGSGLVQFGRPDRVADTLRPKVLGALAIEDVFRTRPPLDFLVFFSSRAALEGQPGGADYAVANAFLDAFSRTCAVPAVRTLSINWPAWSGVGMAVAPALPAAAGSIRWHRVVRPPDEPVIDEHRLDDVPVAPGTSHLDFVVTAFREAVLDGERATIHLEDVVLQQMMTLSDDRRLEVLFEPGRDGGYRFTVASAPLADSAGTALRTHARGLVRRAATQPRSIDLAALRQRLAVVVPAPREPEGTQAFTLGPRFRTITAVHGGVPGEKLLTLALPESYAPEVARHSLHPSLLDAATTSARDRARDAIHLPFMYRKILVHDTLPAELVSHIRRRSGSPDTIVADLDVVTPDGRLLVEVEGFTMRRPPEHQSLANLVRPDGRAPLVPRPAAGGNGLPPNLGADLFLTLLGSRTPHQVGVLRYQGGGFVAGASSPTAQATLPSPPFGAEAPVPSPGPGAGPAVTASAPEGPPKSVVDGITEQLRAMWADALGIPEVGLTEDFFELGGNSLTAIELMSVIRERLGVDLSVAAVFDHSTLSSLAAEVERRLAETRAGG